MGLDVKYSCVLCGITLQSVDVRYRDVGEDIAVWMDVLAKVLSEDHRARSPHCTPKVLSEVHIPHPEYQSHVGYPPQH